MIYLSKAKFIAGNDHEQLFNEFTQYATNQWELDANYDFVHWLKTEFKLAIVLNNFPDTWLDITWKVSNFLCTNNCEQNKFDFRDQKNLLRCYAS